MSTDIPEPAYDSIVDVNSNGTFVTENAALHYYDQKAEGDKR